MNDELPPRYRVSRKARAPLIAFMLDALRAQGCRIVHAPDPKEAPFRIVFETPLGEKIGIIAYAFLATETPTRNRPDDEHSFQIKYGDKDEENPDVEHDIWQDPFGVYVTLFCGINPEQGFFIGADPVLHSPTKFHIRFEFKQEAVDRILADGWHVWERKTQRETHGPVEVLVGGRPESFLRYVRFERDALREDQGHRQLLGERAGKMPLKRLIEPGGIMLERAAGPRIHSLAREFEMSDDEVLDLIGRARRLKMAVRGWVAEEHLVRNLQRVSGVSDCERIDEEGGADVRLRFEGSRPIKIECKNVLRTMTAKKLARIDFQRTRPSKGDPCSRYYSPNDFDVVAACLHAVTLNWQFKFVPTNRLPRFTDKCPHKINNNVSVDNLWTAQVEEVLRQVVNG